MNYPWDRPLREDQISNPILETLQLGAEVILPAPSDSALDTLFPGTGHQLKTWARTPGIKLKDPHWIGVKKGTPLHTDPGYPRYSHQLMVRSDGWIIRGTSLEELPLSRGLAFCIDTYSPHQLRESTRPVKGASPFYYVAASIDADEPLSLRSVIGALVGFANEPKFAI